MIEFLTELDKATITGKWAQFKKATSGSKGEVKKRMQAKGGFWWLFSGAIASVVASGDLGKHNNQLEKQKTQMEKSAIDVLHSMNILYDLISHDQPRSEIEKAAKRLKADNMMMKKQASEMIRVVDEYKRVHDDDKKAGALRFTGREYDRHDFREIFKHLNMIEDNTYYVDKVAAAAMTNQYDYALSLIRSITNSSL